MSQITNNPRADRRAFVAQLIAGMPDALIVSGLGSAAYDVYAAGDRDKNYYLWGAMGGSTSIGLGLALAYIITQYVLHDRENPALWFALSAIGGGAGLIASYRVEKKELLDKTPLGS